MEWKNLYSTEYQYLFAVPIWHTPHFEINMSLNGLQLKSYEGYFN